MIDPQDGHALCIRWTGFNFAYVVVVDEASFESSSPTSVTGTSLVSMMLVDEMDELRKRLTMWADSLEAFLPPPLPTLKLPAPPSPVRRAFVVRSRVGGSVIGTRRVVAASVDVVEVVGGVVVVVLRRIHGGSGRSVVVVVVETGHGMKGMSFICPSKRGDPTGFDREMESFSRQITVGSTFQ